MTEKEQQIANLQKEMEKAASEIRILINGMPPEELLGYIYSQLMIVNTTISSQQNSNIFNDTKVEMQFLLEYVHAVLASDIAPSFIKFEEKDCAKLFTLCKYLRKQAMMFAMISSANTDNKDFGSNTPEIEFHAKSCWVMIRGNRYQVLEGEFYQYVLTPHDDILREIYGVGAVEIAQGFQELANVTFKGTANAIEEMLKQFQDVQDFATKQKKTLEDVMEEWISENKDRSKAVALAFDDMFRGGIVNISKHTKLPLELLKDLSYQRGEEVDFFKEGDFSGTPYRTLPVRKKPLIKLGTDYYSIDPCFIRDSGYRSLLFNLIQKKPDYKELFNERQKVMSEAAFPEILSTQLTQSIVYKEVYYRDPKTKQWFENDTLVLVDDILYLIEAKAGAAATIASPELDFKRHAQSIKELIIKAYKQCERFFEYIKSSDEVPLYNFIDGRHKEICRIRHSDYRVMIPIGLTVESFSPFSAFSKNLPEIKPLLGQYGFISLSIDDLFVLKRMLPTTGVFAHYMEVRQAVSNLKQGILFDEIDHLGAYLTKNRFDLDIIDQAIEGKSDLIIFDKMSKIVDKAFEDEHWDIKPKPTQNFPSIVLKVLNALDTSHAPGWLSIESIIRNFGEESRNDFASYLSEIHKEISKCPSLYFAFTGEGQAIFVWMQNSRYEIEWKKLNDKASAFAISINEKELKGVLIKVDKLGVYESAEHFKIHFPIEETEENTHIFKDAKIISQKRKLKIAEGKKNKLEYNHKQKIGRNDPCPCKSGKKYKKCHGC